MHRNNRRTKWVSNNKKTENKFIQINPFIPLENIYFLTPVLLVEEIIVIKWGFKFYWYSPRDMFLVSFSVGRIVSEGPSASRRYENESECINKLYIICKDDECILLGAIIILLLFHKSDICIPLDVINLRFCVWNSKHKMKLTFLVPWRALKEHSRMARFILFLDKWYDLVFFWLFFLNRSYIDFFFVQQCVQFRKWVSTFLQGIIEI